MYTLKKDLAACEVFMDSLMSSHRYPQDGYGSAKLLHITYGWIAANRLYLSGFYDKPPRPLNVILRMLVPLLDYWKDRLNMELKRYPYKKVT